MKMQKAWSPCDNKRKPGLDLGCEIDPELKIETLKQTKCMQILNIML